MELKQAIKVCKIVNDFANSIDKTVDIEDLKTLSELSPRLNDDLDFLDKWINNCVVYDTSPQVTEEPVIVDTSEPWLSVAPDAEWRKIIDTNLMVSNYGHIWSIDKKELMKQTFYDGDLRISLGDKPGADTRRVAVLVTKAFQVYSPDRNGDYIIGYKDGDRRNLKIDNIYWKKPSDEVVEIRRLLIEDICRRILEFNGDIEQLFPLYDGCHPTVSKLTIEQIRDKSLYSNISDLFFVNDNGTINPRTDAMAVVPTDNAAPGMDVGGFFMMSGDKKMTSDLMRDKIKRNETLSLDEKVIIVFMAMDSIGMSKAKDPKKISNVIKSTFDIDIGFDFISQVINDYTSEISEMFRGGK